MDEAQAGTLFAAARIARLGTVDPAGHPHLVPITFALHGNVIVSAIDHKPKRSTNLKRLRNIAVNPRVSVLADHYDEDWSLLWWIRCDGLARVLHGPDRAEPITWLAAKYDQYAEHPPAGPVIWIEVSTWRSWTSAPPRR